GCRGGGAASPAWGRPQNTLGESAPASRPITVKGRPKALKNFTSASGWLSTFASFTISPVASTMHTLEDSSGIVVHGAVSQWVCDAWGPVHKHPGTPFTITYRETATFPLS